MRITSGLAVLAIALSNAAMAQSPLPAASASSAPASFPAWAYPWAPDFKAAPDDGVPRHVPDSSASFTITQERDLFFVPDWHPDDHPAMPEIVAHGRRPDVRACGSCHRAEGTGGPENASLAGLPAAYIIQQIEDYKSGAPAHSAAQAF
jgi:cytochrome c553